MADFINIAKNDQPPEFMDISNIIGIYSFLGQDTVCLVRKIDTQIITEDIERDTLGVDIKTLAEKCKQNGAKFIEFNTYDEDDSSVPPVTDYIPVEAITHIVYQKQENGNVQVTLHYMPRLSSYNGEYSQEEFTKLVQEINTARSKNLEVMRNNSKLIQDDYTQTLFFKDGGHSVLFAANKVVAVSNKVSTDHDSSALTKLIFKDGAQLSFSLKTFFNTPRIINKDDEKEVFEYVTLSAKKAARISSLIAKHCGLIEIPTEPSIAQKLTYDKEHIGALFVKAEAIEKITISDPETYKPLDLTIGTYFNLNLSKAHNIYVTLKEANPKMLFPLTSSFKTKEERDTALDTFISTLNKTNEPKKEHIPYNGVGRRGRGRRPSR